MSSHEASVNVSCRICKIREATTITGCGHRFCGKCIRKWLGEEGQKTCPHCQVDLGVAPMERLITNDSLQESRTISKKVAAAPAATTQAIPKQNFRSLNSIINSEVKNSRAKRTTKKKQRGARLTQQKSSRNKDDESFEDNSSSSASIEIINKYTRPMSQSLIASGKSVGPADDRQIQNNFQTSRQQANATKPSSSVAKTTEPCLDLGPDKGKNKMFRTSKPSSSVLATSCASPARDKGQGGYLNTWMLHVDAPEKTSKPSSSVLATSCASPAREKGQGGYLNTWMLHVDAREKTSQPSSSVATEPCIEPSFEDWGGISTKISNSKEGKALPKPQSAPQKPDQFAPTEPKSAFANPENPKNELLKDHQKPTLSGDNQNTASTSIPNPKPPSRPIWFSLIALDEKKSDSPPLPQIVPNYIRIKPKKDDTLTISHMHKFLQQKLNLASEHEVFIMCDGVEKHPWETMDEVLEWWLRRQTPDTVTVAVGSSAKGFMLPLHYARSDS